jgi:hypothetical protein
VPDIPKAAVDAAERAIIEAATDFGQDNIVAGSSCDLARVALGAAAPILAETVARKILAHMETCDLEAIRRGHPIPRGWRRDLRIAAQVAALAFNTDEDNKRLATEAIKHGEAAGCNPEVPGGG